MFTPDCIILFSKSAVRGPKLYVLIHKGVAASPKDRRRPNPTRVRGLPPAAE